MTMVRKASEAYRDWREVVLASPWVKPIDGDVQCRATAGWVPVKFRGDPVKSAPYRCRKRAKFQLKAVVTRSMLTVDAVSGNYCPRHFLNAISEHEGERERWEKWFAKKGEQEKWRMLFG